LLFTDIYEMAMLAKGEPDTGVSFPVEEAARPFT
jgi:hypothetical protein